MINHHFPGSTTPQDKSKGPIEHCKEIITIDERQTKNMGKQPCRAMVTHIKGEVIRLTALIPDPKGYFKLIQNDVEFKNKIRPGFLLMNNNLKILR